MMQLNKNRYKGATALPPATRAHLPEVTLYFCCNDIFPIICFELAPVYTPHVHIRIVSMRTFISEHNPLMRALLSCASPRPVYTKLLHWQLTQAQWWAHWYSFESNFDPSDTQNRGKYTNQCCGLNFNNRVYVRLFRLSLNYAYVACSIPQLDGCC